MIAVLDVCGAMEILFQTPKMEKFNNIIVNASMRLSSDLYVPELTNVLWRYWKAGKLSADECSQYIDRGIKLIDRFIDSKSLWEEVFGQSVASKHSVYDLFYAIIARRYNGVLVTNDDELSKICDKLNIQYYF
ncbi:MAG: type II toxin-antitoxin system VapC family toxin [Treponema sp.]|jgi:predicted nucleic acid-binding protein|nr:type II toxin-antitoxin system VapC family toxin [Treponema sp.]